MQKPLMCGCSTNIFGRDVGKSAVDSVSVTRLIADDSQKGLKNLQKQKRIRRKKNMDWKRGKNNTKVK